MLKRLLSTILTIAMILSLIPASFATGETTEAENVKIVYDIYNNYGYSYTISHTGTDYYTNVVNGSYGGDTSATRIALAANFKDYTKTNGMWRYFAHSSTNEPKTSYGRWIIEPVFTNEWFALGFNVPVAGTYDASFMQYNGGSTSYTSSFAVQIFPKGTSVETIKTEAANITADNCLVYVSGAQGGTALTKKPTTASDVNFPTAGEYILVVKCLELGTTTNADADGMFFDFFTLSATDGDGTKSVPMGVTGITDEDASIEVGETTTATYGDLYGSADWMTYDDSASTITYVSSNEKVATVDADGNVTGKGAGTAEISAVVDGAQLTSATISVTAPSVKLVYDLSNSFKVECGIATSDTAYYTEISNAFADAGLALNENYTDYAFSNGMWRYYAHTTQASPYTSSGRWGLTKANVGEWFALGFNVPVAGTYDASFMGFNSGSNDHTSTYAVKIFPKGTSADEIEMAMSTITWDATSSTVIGDALTYVPGNKGGSLTTKEPATALGISFPTAGEYILVVKSIAEGTSGTNVKNLWLDHFILTQSDTNAIYPIGATKLFEASVVIGDTTTASISDKLYNANDWGTYDATGKTVTYASSDPNVATVDAATGVVTAKALGTAEITATVDGAQLAPATITVADKEATDEVEKVSFMATSTLNGDGIEVTVTDKDYTIGAVDSSIAPGTTVEVTANPVTGYIFRGWKRGSKDNGVWVSTSSTYSFPLLTNTYLTAIYDVDTATDAAVNVEFYNFNGQFLVSKAVEDKTFETLASDVEPTLTGYNSFFWTIDGNTEIVSDTVFEKLTRVVAKFDDEGRDKFAVTVPSNVESNYNSGTYAYDTEIEMTADAAGLWKVNGEPVAYGDSYTYCVWSNATIEFAEAANDNKPILSIDDNTTGGARMISYDANGADIVEVGILFGSDANIASAGSRAVSRARGTEACGQFTAKAYDGTTTTARAYLIYNDNGTYRVIYAD